MQERGRSGASPLGKVTAPAVAVAGTRYHHRNRQRSPTATRQCQNVNAQLAAPLQGLGLLPSAAGMGSILSTAGARAYHPA
jgi:hypothetical protein